MQKGSKRRRRGCGKCRREAEKKIGKPIISKENYLVEPEKVKRKRLQ
jgi:hypothetical protein